MDNSGGHRKQRIIKPYVKRKGKGSLLKNLVPDTKRRSWVCTCEKVHSPSTEVCKACGDERK